MRLEYVAFISSGPTAYDLAYLEWLKVPEADRNDSAKGGYEHARALHKWSLPGENPCCSRRDCKKPPPWYEPKEKVEGWMNYWHCNPGSLAVWDHSAERTAVRRANSNDNIQLTGKVRN